MPNLTYSQLLALSDSEQLMDERIAIICEGEKCGEETALQIATGAQMKLWDEPKQGNSNRRGQI